MAWVATCQFGINTNYYYSSLPSLILSTQSLASATVSACSISMKFENIRRKIVGSNESLYSTFSILVSGKLRLTFTWKLSQNLNTSSQCWKIFFFFFCSEVTIDEPATLIYTTYLAEGVQVFKSFIGQTKLPLSCQSNFWAVLTTNGRLGKEPCFDDVWNVFPSSSSQLSLCLRSVISGGCCSWKEVCSYCRVGEKCALTPFSQGATFTTKVEFREERKSSS